VSQLLACTAIMAGIAALILRRILPWRRAIPAAVIKLAIPLIFFSVYYDGQWTIIDDLTYYRQGRLLLASGYNPISVFLDPKGFALLLYVSASFHVLYGWFNLLTQYLLADAYWAPVLGNVLLTCIAAVLLRCLATDAGAESSYADALAVFFLFHWEILAWSSFINVKDLLVMTLTLWMMGSIAKAEGARKWTAWISVLLAGFLLFWIRFYVPLVLGAVYGLYRMRNPLQDKRLLASLVAGMAAFFFVVRGMVASVATIVNLRVTDLLFGWLRTLFSPQPWSLQRAYGFLLVPSVLNLALLPLTIYGAYLLIRRVRSIRFAFLYAAVLLVSVAAVPELQGPRHRIQILFLVAWAQFHGLYSAAAAFAKARSAGVQARVA
jgi:hypothetical protein